MSSTHHELLTRELSMARELIREAKYEDAFRHLERAPALGQAAAMQDDRPSASGSP